MNFIRSIKNRSGITLLLLSIAMCTAAQDKTVGTLPTVTSGYNQLAILLTFMIILLAFVIWGMGQVLTALGRQLVDKNKTSSKILSVILLAGFSLMTQISSAQDATVAAVKEVPNYGGLSESVFNIFMIVLGVEVVVILFLAFSIRRMYAELLPEKIRSAKEGLKLINWWSGLDKKLFTRAVPVEKEADVMLDHDYDGIRELDNALPPWWKYGFYVTIVVAFIYLLNFHVFGVGKNPTEEYNAEMEQARLQKELYDANNKDKIDENNVPVADAAGIKAGQQLFEVNCAACHLKDGGGNVGPNLTDDYWLHKGSLNDIYNTIKVGYPDKGMQSWNSQFTPRQISHIAGFIRSLHGTKPATPKAQQGEFWVDGPVAGAKSDSVSVKPDSAAVKK